MSFIPSPHSLPEDELTRQKTKLKADVSQVPNSAGVKSSAVRIRNGVSNGNAITRDDSTNGDFIPISANGMKMVNAADTVTSPLKLIQSQAKNLKLH
jgi:hypothetical protein